MTPENSALASTASFAKFKAQERPFMSTQKCRRPGRPIIRPAFALTKVYSYTPKPTSSQALKILAAALPTGKTRAGVASKPALVEPELMNNTRADV